MTATTRLDYLQHGGGAIVALDLLISNVSMRNGIKGDEVSF